MSRAPNMQQVAEAAGVSKSAVSLALRDDPRLAVATRRRVQEAAARLGYKKNPIVASLMAQLRVSQTPKFQANFALLNCSANRTLFDIPHFSEIRRGIRERAQHVGYGVEEFWADEPGVPLPRLRQILHTRNIRGLVLATEGSIGSLGGLDSFFPEFCFVTVGAVRTTPQLPRAAGDHFEAARQATRIAIHRGYKRPALALSAGLDQIADQRFSAGFVAAAGVLPQADRIAPWIVDGWDRTAFAKWIKTEKPGAIVTDNFAILEWARELKLTVPEELGLIHLDWMPHMREWAGIQQNNRVVGVAAADVVIQQLANNESGAPQHPRFVVIESEFVEGPSVLPESASSTMAATVAGAGVTERKSTLPAPTTVTSRSTPLVPQ